MKKASSALKMTKAFVLALVMLVGLLPLQSTAATTTAQPTPNDVHILAVNVSAGVIANVYNNAQESKDVSLIFAAYEENGRLRHVKASSVTLDAASFTGPLSFDYDTTAHPDDILTLLAWDRLSLLPLDVTEFFFIAVDEQKKTARPYQVSNDNGVWTWTPADDVDVILAYKPAEYVGAALPALTMTPLRMPNGESRIRVFVSL